MKILYMGIGSQKLQDIAVSMGHEVVAVQSANSIEIEQYNKHSKPYILLNGEHEVNKFDVFVLNDSSKDWDILYSKTHYKPWFSNPFNFRTSLNSYFHYVKVRGYLHTLPLNGKVSGGVSNYKYLFPEGHEVSYLVVFDKIINLSRTNAGMNLHTARNIRKYMKEIGMSSGVLTLYKSYERGSLFFQEFTPYFNWIMVPNHIVEHSLNKMLFYSNLSKRG